MRAVCLLEPGVVGTVDVEEPVCGPDDVVVRMRAVGLCGSDLSVYGGSRAVPYVPWVLGHEGGGTLVAIGSAVEDRRIGELVVIEPNVPCFSCPACTDGRTSLCPHRRILGMNTPGILGEHVAVPARMTWPVPAAWGPEQLVVLEPFAVAMAAVRRSRIAPGDAAVVIGAGSLGLQVCRALCALNVETSVLDMDAGRIRTAEALGVRCAADDLTCPYVFETAGAPAAFRTALAALEPGGVLTLMGLANSPAELSTADVVRHGQTLLGSIIYDHPIDFRAAIDLMDRGAPDSGLTVSDGVPASAAGTAFEQAAALPAKSWIDLASW